MHAKQQIVIIGAGPVGCYLGQLLKKEGYQPLLIEEDQEIGRPVRCAGIIGQGLYEDLEIMPSRESILNEIHGAEINYNSSSFTISRNKVAYIIDRAVFDSSLSRGLDVRLNTKFIGLSRIGGRYKVETTKGDFTADLVIGADGPNSKVRKVAGLRGNIKLYKGLQYRIKSNYSNASLVDVRFIRPFHEFIWIIPEGNGIIRVGVISSHPRRDLEHFIKEKGIKGEIIEKNGGLIPIGTTALVEEGVAVVGDAAAQVKPITSGGIYYGLKSAELLAKAIHSGELSAYQRTWSAQFGQEVNFCLLARGVMESINDGTREKIFNYMKDNAHLIEQLGDFENHSSVIWGLAANPQTYKTIGITAFDLFRNPKFILGTFNRLRHLIFK